jgi:acyl transferase domain-containing protein
VHSNGPQDGRSSSLTAPSGPAQQDVIRTALAAGDILPLQVCSHHQQCRGCIAPAVLLLLHAGVVRIVQKELHARLLAFLQVGGLQMHGTGTPLGDPIEVGAAAAVMQVCQHQVANPSKAPPGNAWLQRWIC